MDKTTQQEGETRKLRGQNRVAFLAHLIKIRPDIEAGWPLKGIYNRYADTLDMSYNQFVRYVNRYILQKEPSSRSVTVPQAVVVKKPVSPPESPAPKAPPTGKKPTSGFKQFVPGPTNPNPEELW